MKLLDKLHIIDTGTRATSLLRLSPLLGVVCVLSACDLKPLPDDLNPAESSFLLTDSRSAEAVRIVEQEDDFIVFNRFFVYRVSKDNGTIAGFKDLRDTITGYFFADVLKFQDGTMLATSINGGFTFIDEDLNLFTSDRNTPFGNVGGTFLDSEQEVVFIASLGQNSMIGPFTFFWPEGVTPDVIPFEGYFPNAGFSFPYSPAPNHLVTSSKALFPLIKDGITCSMACYTRNNPELDWITDFINFCPNGFAAMSNGNILVFGLGDDGNSILHTLNGPNGNLLTSKVLCTSYAEFPGDIVSTSDGGFALVSIVNATQEGCISDTINGDNDIRLVKLNASLTMQWEQVYSLDLKQEVYHLIQTSDGGFAMAGKTELNSIDQFLFIKTDDEGNLTP